MTSEIDSLVLEYLPQARRLAESIHRRMPRGREELDDVVQVANMGLMDAAKKFDPSRGIEFWRYARQRVLGEIRDWQRESDEGWTRFKGRTMSVKSLDAIREVPDVRRPDWPAPDSRKDLREMEEREAMEFVLSRCTPRERKALRMMLVHGLTQKEAGEIAGWRESRTSQVLLRVKKILREQLGRAGIVPRTRAG